MGDIIEELINDAITFAQCDGSPEEQGQAEQTMENTAARLRAELFDVKAERDSMVNGYEDLRARFSEREGQEPVAEVIPNVVGVEIAWISPPSGGRPQVGTKLYTTPPPAPPAPSVPDGWKLERSKYGIMVTAPSGSICEVQDTSEPRFGAPDRILVNFLDAMLTATPAPPRSESVVEAEALEKWARKMDDLAYLDDEGPQRLIAGLDVAAAELRQEAARLRSEGRE